MRCGSLFAGIGGLELGLERAGMEVRWQVERDDYCRRVLAKHWPDVKRYEDVRDVGAHNLEAVDLICGGFPCQPVSQAGKKKAQDDERWLWPEFARIVRELRPGYVLVENVPGLLVRGFGDVLGDLAALGYDAEWGCVSAASVGAPHLRRRVFLIAHIQRPSSALSHPLKDGLRHVGQRDGEQHDIARPPILDHDGEEGLVADTDSRRRKSVGFEEPTRLESTRRRIPDGRSQGRQLDNAETRYGEWWSVEPDVGRVAHGVPSRMDRVRALGNAVVPQVAEYVGRRIMKAAR